MKKIVIANQKGGVGKTTTANTLINYFSKQNKKVLAVDLDKNLLCFDIKELGTQLKKIGMLVIQDQVWNKV